MRFATALLATAAAFTWSPSASQAQTVPPISSTTTYHKVADDGSNVFYRDSRVEGAPTILLLRGYPASSQHVKASSCRMRCHTSKDAASGGRNVTD